MLNYQPQNQESEKVFKNADSFAMTFDTAWKKFKHKKNEPIPKGKEDKIMMVLEEIKDHPFVQASPEQAKEVAKFRVRLLALD